MSIQTGQPNGRSEKTFPSKVWVVIFRQHPGSRQIARVFLTEEAALSFELQQNDASRQASPFVGTYRNRKED